VTDRLLLVRHGVTDWNREGRWQGRLDPPLSREGRREAAMVAARVAADPALRPVRIVASPLARAAETARVIADAAGVSVEHDDRLVEIDAGEWEGRTHAELEAADGERYRAWRLAVTGVRPPGGEGLDETLARTQAVLDGLADDSHSPVMLVSHGGVLRVFAHQLFSVPADRMWSLDVDNASLAACSAHDGRWRLERWNDVLHLLGRTATHVDEAEGRPLAL
jgi:phosphoserine phosphatase